MRTGAVKEGCHLCSGGEVVGTVPEGTYAASFGDSDRVEGINVGGVATVDRVHEPGRYGGGVFEHADQETCHLGPRGVVFGAVSQYRLSPALATNRYPEVPQPFHMCRPPLAPLT